MNKKLIALLLAAMTILLLVACGDEDSQNEQAQSNDEEENVAEENDDENTSSQEADEEGKAMYQVGETAKITSKGYDFEYEATVNEYEITNDSDEYDMDDFYMNYTEDKYKDSYILISNVTIHNTSDENITPSKHIPMHVSDAGAKAGEDVIYDYFPEFDENLEPGESITGDLITHADIYEPEEFEGYWLKFETITANETIWELPNTVK